MSSKLLTMAEASKLIGKCFATNADFQKKVGIKPMHTGKNVFLYDHDEVIAKGAAYVQKRQRIHEAYVKTLTKKLNPEEKITADMRSEIVSMRSETAAAFNLIMDELSKIKTQLVSLERPTT